MILQVKKKTITRGEATSTHHQALLMCALWHKVTKAHPLVRVMEMMKCLLLMNLCKKILNMLRLALAKEAKNVARKAR